MPAPDTLERHIHPHVNFRDLGGYVTKDGRRVRQGLLYRSGGLYLMTEEELKFFHTLGIKTVMDLRSKKETDVSPDPVLDGVHCLQHSGLEFATGREIDFSPAGMSQIGEAGENQIAVLRNYYRLIPYDNEAFRILFAEIFAQHVPVLFHCHTGKDRTGVFAMLLLLALGVDRETVLEDYLLSRKYFQDLLDDALSEDEAHILAHPEAKELLTMRFSVSEHVGRGVLNDLFSRYPHIEDYFAAEYGYDTGDLEALRDFYLA